MVNRQYRRPWAMGWGSRGPQGDEIGTWLAEDFDGGASQTAIIQQREKAV
ncbi:MAG: hypothetical protein WCS94_10295 [Verrucomicrobiota bacterium]